MSLFRLRDDTWMTSDGEKAVFKYAESQTNDFDQQFVSQ